MIRFTRFCSLTILAAWSTLSFVQAQSIQRCGTVQAIQHRDQQFPGYLNAVNDAFASAQSHAATAEKNNTVYRIPVVVHVVYKSDAENIPDSLIIQQIQVLNEDFRRRNADSVNTRSEFLPFAEDTRIEFFLATTDPQGQPTTGITRTQGSPVFGLFSPFDDNVKKSALGGKDGWPASKYLNVWVCDLVLGLGILGYAYPPVGAPNWPSDQLPADTTVEGVVIHYPVFGPNNPAASGPLATVNRGRTLTHEVGHYLGLRHIWGDGDCTADDGLADTPNASDNAQQICDWTKNTCPEPTGPEFPDQIENYMDYAADSCMNMFSKDQGAQMRANLENFRSQLYIESTTSVEEHGQQALLVYPNPTTEQLVIPVKQAESHPSVHIFDVLGREIPILQQQTEAVGIRIYVQHLPEGSYWGKMGKYTFKFAVVN